MLFGLLLSGSAQARVRHSEGWARQQFQAAERAREALNGRPAQERTRREYQRTIDAYRRVYFGAPASGKADPSVVATAELMVEMGRCFDDDKILRSAINQYKFLRKEYPGSKFRFDALFTIGEIYKDDLGDAALAKNTFEEFLRRYPRNRLADDARQALSDLSQEAAKKDAKRPAKPEKSAALEDESSPTRSGAQDNHRAKLPRVTGIRHWSTPDYTRVAIDLEQDIKFDSQRIGNPDRIFFDLRDAKLASTLLGKTFEVDDGLLRKIRVAQFQPGRARVVLEVDDLSDYTAFLLPNPSRLIIDIHGKQSGRALAKTQSPAPALAKASADQDADTSDAKNDKDDDADLSQEPNPAVKASSKNDPAPATATAKAPKAPASKTVAARNAAGKPIPKTIVDADDDDDSNVALETAVARSPADLRPDLSPAQRSPSKDDSSKKAGPSKTARKGKAGAKTSEEKASIQAREARPTASGDRSLIRALGLKIGKIVIDPGHGGHDTGTIGPNGLEEKDLVLEVARRLGRLLEQRLGAEVVYTRQDDTFIPLETRTAIANRERADLFISIHANSSHDPAARGVETYYLNFTSSAEALEVAARENAVSEKSIYELQDLVKKIALKEKIEESREFASDVQQALHSGLSTRSTGMRDRGVKKAPFIVLIGANMPSILAEVSFVSNPSDERKLETGEYRQRIADSLYRGVAKYASGLSGVKVASRMAKSEGQ